MLLFFLGISGITKYIFSLSGDVISNERIAGYANTAEAGFRIEYVIESLLFFILFLRNYKK